jgi:hypothetical protein
MHVKYSIPFYYCLSSFRGSNTSSAVDLQQAVYDLMAEDQSPVLYYQTQEKPNPEMSVLLRLETAPVLFHQLGINKIHSSSGMPCTLSSIS